MARGRTKQTKATPAKAPKKKGGKAKADRPVKPPPARRSAAQLTAPGTEDPNASPEFDTLIREAYDATATWQAAAADKKKARDKVSDEMKARKIPIYKSSDGIVVKITMEKEKLSITRSDSVREIDLDDDGSDD